MNLIKKFLILEYELQYLYTRLYHSYCTTTRVMSSGNISICCSPLLPTDKAGSKTFILGRRMWTPLKIPNLQLEVEKNRGDNLGKNYYHHSKWLRPVYPDWEKIGVSLCCEKYRGACDFNWIAYKVEALVTVFASRLLERVSRNAVWRPFAWPDMWRKCTKVSVCDRFTWGWHLRWGTIALTSVPIKELKPAKKKCQLSNIVSQRRKKSKKSRGIVRGIIWLFTKIYL